ncbi:MAG: hypothetical protein ACRD90_01965 [Nitrosopumilaceae archaeon]
MKKIEFGLISIILVLAIAIIVTFFAQSEELICLRLYKSFTDFKDQTGLESAERVALVKHAKLVVEYVERGCPDFNQQDFIYRNAKSILEKFGSEP